MGNHRASAALAAACLISFGGQAMAAGEVVITQAGALAGGVTPVDAPGFPVTLSVPGHYQLGSNIYPTANAAGIHFAHRNITLDLNGFEMHGANIANHGIVGVQNGGFIRYGTITGFRFDGINGGNFWTIEKVHLLSNGRFGFSGAIGCMALHNTVVSHGDDGIRCTNASHMEGNILLGNGGAGIFMQAGSAIGNTVIGNDSFGIQGSDTGYGNNTFDDNNGAGDEAVGTLPMHPNACVGACP